jgi:hypothetical protein
MGVKVKNNKEWDVVNGVIVVKTPAVEAKTEPVATVQFDKQLARLTKQRDRIAARLAVVQAEFDEIDKTVTDLTALRDLVNE